MIISKKLEIKVRELEEKGYSFIYIEDYVKGFYKGYFESKIKIAKNMLLKGSSLEFVLSVTGLTEQELKDYGVHLEICSQG
ncbi:hypothetical protein E4414_22160 (plasmid) [Leptospira interrogans]|uniref:hypothetical protein n=1 Tax=Leptospira interrogans TaxID=173 RepID=UPI0010C02449|nr:hypothetical protein [Leptospira interrogans]QCO35703.1 hypothetical protein E4414_22160 [Leptospira interrogans]